MVKIIPDLEFSKSLKCDLEYIYQKTKHILNNLDGKKIFFTGGTGFIGKSLLDFFLYLRQIKSVNLELIVLSRNHEAFLQKFPKFSVPYIQFVTGDIVDFDFFSLPECHIIIHAAADADAKINNEQPLKIINSIVEGSKKVFDYGVSCKVQKVLYLSSGAVYGIQPDNMAGFPEAYSGGPNTLLPTSAYAEAKRLAELLCVCYHKQYNMNISIARCFAFVGPYLPLDKHFAIGNFIRNGLRGEDIIIKGTGLPLRSYMYSADLVIWLLYILLKGESGHAYNLGSEKSVTIKELAYTVGNFFPDLSVKVLNTVSQTDRNQNYIPDVTKIKSELLVPDILDLNEAIRRTVQYYLENE